MHRVTLRVMLLVVASDHGSRNALRQGGRRRRRRRGGLIMLNAGGWAALIALGSVVSVLGSAFLPLPVALGLGCAASF